MRLTAIEKQTIKDTIARYDPVARVFLFGSRTIDNRSGGDIDLLVESKLVTFSKKLEILADLKTALGDQKIDLILSKSIDKDDDAFIESVRSELIEL